MKKLTVAISAVAASVLMAMSAQAAEIYNKDSNKLDLYGKVNAKHYFSSNDADDGDTTYASQEFKSIKSSEKSVSSKETTSEANPKTSDKGLIYGGGFILTVATIIAVRKKIKMLGI